MRQSGRSPASLYIREALARCEVMLFCEQTYLAPSDEGAGKRCIILPGGILRSARQSPIPEDPAIGHRPDINTEPGGDFAKVYK